MNYWLFKSEPIAYSYDHLVEDYITEWDGIRVPSLRELVNWYPVPCLVSNTTDTRTRALVRRFPAPLINLTISEFK